MCEIAKVHERNRAVFFVSQAEPGPEPQPSAIAGITGVLAVLYLSRTGEAAVLGGEFNPNSIRPEWLVGTCDEPAAIYAWAVAARGAKARNDMVFLAKRLSHAVLADLRQYSHAITPAGERMLHMLGFSELRRGGLVEPITERIFHREPTGSVSASGTTTETFGSRQ